jgi:hypothetical protein
MCTDGNTPVISWKVSNGKTIMAVISWKGFTFFGILGNMHYRK